MTAVNPHPQQDLQREASNWISLAQSLRIADSDDYEIAALHLKAIKGLLGEADDVFDPIIKKAHEAHAEAIAQKRKITDPLTQAESLIKRSMGGYVQEQNRKAEEGRRRAQAEAELLAAKQREAEIEEAESAGATVEEVEVITQAPLRVAPVVAAAAVPKVQGISSRDVWKFEVTNKQLLDQFIAQNPRFSALTCSNNTAIGAMVRSLKSAFSIPGVKVWCESSIAGSKARGGN